jgi:hypothetical protein
MLGVTLPLRLVLVERRTPGPTQSRMYFFAPHRSERLKRVNRPKSPLTVLRRDRLGGVPRESFRHAA